MASASDISSMLLDKGVGWRVAMDAAPENAVGLSSGCSRKGLWLCYWRRVGVRVVDLQARAAVSSGCGCVSLGCGCCRQEYSK